MVLMAQNTSALALNIQVITVLTNQLLLYVIGYELNNDNHQI